MIPRLRDRWRRLLDLDQIRPHQGTLGGHTTNVLNALVAGASSRPIELLLRYTLLEALLDGAIGLHFYHDEDDNCLRILGCRADPPDAGQDIMLPSCIPFDGPRLEWIESCAPRLIFVSHTKTAYPPVWHELFPPPTKISSHFLRRLRWYAGLHDGETDGKLSMRLDGRPLSAVVVAPQPDDFRAFFGALRPPIRPKLRRHFDELGLPHPG